MDYLGRTGLDALKGADILRTAPEKYQSTVEYGDNAIARNLRAISQVLLADLGTRVFYTQHGGYDTHAAEIAVHTQLWTDLSDAISCFFADLREHSVEDRVVMLVFTEFGRRVKDNGSGSDHGSGGLSMVMGAPVKGGQYNEFPVPGATPTCWRATCTSTTTTAASTPRWWSGGWGWTGGKLWGGVMRWWGWFRGIAWIARQFNHYPGGFWGILLYFLCF